MRCATRDGLKVHLQGLLGGQFAGFDAVDAKDKLLRIVRMLILLKIWIFVHTFKALAVLKARGGIWSRPPLRMSMSSMSRLQSSRIWTTGIACFSSAGSLSFFTAS